MSFAFEESRPNEGSVLDLSFLVGEWEGEGRHGDLEFRASAECKWALSNQLIEMRLLSFEGNRLLDEVKVLYSFDRVRRLYRAREFHADGGVGEFNGVPDAARRVFTFRRISGENIAGGGEQREILQLADSNTLVILLEDARNGGPFQTRSELHLVRKIATFHAGGEVL